jgi:Predicted membrane protein
VCLSFLLGQWLKVCQFTDLENRLIDRARSATREHGPESCLRIKYHCAHWTSPLDQTNFAGALDINLRPVSIQLRGQMDQFTVDDYLQSAHTNGGEINTTASPEPLLLPGSYQLEVGRLKIRDIPMNNFQLEIGIQADELTLSKLQTEVFDGTLTASGNHLLVPQISNLNGTLDGLEINRMPLTDAMKELSGTLSGAFDLRTAGQTVDVITPSLTGPVRLNLTDARLGDLNIAEATCQALGQTAANATPTEDTASIRLQFQEGVAQIESLKSQLANLKLNKFRSVQHSLHWPQFAG